jgi:hypothetical protein
MLCCGALLGPAPASAKTFPLVGGVQASPGETAQAKRFECSTGQYLVGLRGKTGMLDQGGGVVLGQLQIVCAPVMGDVVGDWTTPFAACCGGGSKFAQAYCSANYVVTVLGIEKNPSTGSVGALHFNCYGASSRPLPVEA